MNIRASINVISTTNIILGVILALLSTHIVAKQTKFTKVQQDEHYLFSYQWNDYLDNSQQLNFSLQQADIFNHFRGFGIYQPTLANEYVNNSLKKYFKKNPLSGVVLTFNGENNDYRINIKSQKQSLIDKASIKLSELKEKFSQQYLTKVYYQQFTTFDQIDAVKPDHVRIAKESVADFKLLKPIILETVSIKNIRKVSNYVLGFIQNIPYATLESRISSSGVGFSPPLKLLWENQGDCDSKMTLAASILRALMPRIKMAFIYIENHALIGIEVEPEADDITIIADNITYVLAEPTGPAVLPLGKIALASEQSINNGHYIVEPFHAGNEQLDTNN